MKAIILAAGRGSRMGSKTDVLPKCLMQLWGKTLLQWQLKAIREAGIAEIAIVTGYHAEQIKEVDITYFHNAEWENTNMFATLARAQNWLEKDSCIVSYADIIYTKKAIRSLITSEEDIAITYYTKFLQLWQERFENPLEDIETFKLNNENDLIEIGNKAKQLSEIEGQYMGLLKFTPLGWSEILNKLRNNPPKPIQKIDMTCMLGHIISQKAKVKAIPYDEIWLEVDNQNDLNMYSDKSEFLKELL